MRWKKKSKFSAYNHSSFRHIGINLYEKPTILRKIFPLVATLSSLSDVIHSTRNVLKKSNKVLKNNNNNSELKKTWRNIQRINREKKEKSRGKQEDRKRKIKWTSNKHKQTLTRATNV